MNIGVLHPGQMGTGIASTFRTGGHRVFWLPAGRSKETAQRAASVELEALASIDQMTERCEIILSICPPHAARDVARVVAGSSFAFNGIYIDANAIAPETASDVSTIVTAVGAHYVDGSMIGPPPPTDRARMYLSGPHAAETAAMLGDIPLNIFVLEQNSTAASSLKMTYAAWTKGSAALMLAVRAMACANGVEDELLEEWTRLNPTLLKDCDRAVTNAITRGWRWAGEMQEIAKSFGSDGLPAGFGEAAAEVFRRVPAGRATNPSDDLRRVVEDLNEMTKPD